MARKDVDMTHGSILKHYLAFAAPLAASASVSSVGVTNPSTE